MEEIIIERSFTYNDALENLVYALILAENKNKEKYFKFYIGIPEKEYLQHKQIGNEFKIEEIQKLGSNFSLVKNNLNLFKKYEKEEKEKINNNLICIDGESLYTFDGDLTKIDRYFVDSLFKKSMDIFRTYLFSKRSITNTEITKIETDEVIKKTKELEKETISNNLSPKELSEKVAFFTEYLYLSNKLNRTMYFNVKDSDSLFRSKSMYEEAKDRFNFEIRGNEIIKEAFKKFFIKEFDTSTKKNKKYELEFNTTKEGTPIYNHYEKNPLELNLKNSIENYFVLVDMSIKFHSLFDNESKPFKEMIKEQENLKKEFFKAVKTQTDKYTKKYGLDNLKRIFNSNTPEIYENHRDVRDIMIEPAQEFLIKMAMNNFQLIESIKGYEKGLNESKELYKEFEKLSKAKEQINSKKDLEKYKDNVENLYKNTEYGRMYKREVNYYKKFFPKSFAKLEKEYKSLNTLNFSKQKDNSIER